MIDIDLTNPPTKFGQSDRIVRIYKKMLLSSKLFNDVWFLVEPGDPRIDSSRALHMIVDRRVRKEQKDAYIEYYTVLDRERHGLLISIDEGLYGCEIFVCLYERGHLISNVKFNEDFLFLNCNCNLADTNR